MNNIRRILWIQNKVEQIQRKLWFLGLDCHWLKSRTEPPASCFLSKDECWHAPSKDTRKQCNTVQDEQCYSIPERSWSALVFQEPSPSRDCSRGGRRFLNNRSAGMLPAVNEKLSMARSATTSRRERQCKTMEKEECQCSETSNRQCRSFPSKSAMFPSFNVSGCQMLTVRCLADDHARMLHVPSRNCHRKQGRVCSLIPKIHTKEVWPSVLKTPEECLSTIF